MLKVRKAEHKDLKIIYPMFEDAFPPDERKTKEHFIKLLEGKRYHLLIAEEEKENIIGFSFMYIAEDQSYNWLDYIAISEKYQSKGYGSVFYRELCKWNPNMRQMFIEIEKPNGMDDNQFRRIQYYERLGAQKILENYCLPTPSGSIPMYLYGANDVASMSSEEIMTAINDVLTTIHFDLPHVSKVIETIRQMNHY